MKYVKWGLIVAYIYFILTQTVIGRVVHPEPIFKGPFWEVQNGMWTDIRLNILLFIPLGLLIGGWKGVVGGFLLSVSIETIQYIGCLGYCEIDDVINNSIGAGIGAAIHAAVSCMIKRFKEG